MAKKDGFNEMIDKMITDKIEDKSPPGEGTDVGPIDDEEQISGLFSRCASNEGFYLKVYRRHPVPKEMGGRPVFLLDITQPEVIEDLESELLRIGQQMMWPDGLYEAKLFKRGEPGIQGARRMALQFPKTPISSPGILGVPNNGSANAFETLSQTAKLIKELKEASDSGPSTHPASVNPESIMAAVTEAYKAGISASQGNQNNSSSILEIVKVLKELAPPQPKGPDILSILKEVGAFSSPKKDDDFFEKLLKMKELGLFGSTVPAPDPTAKALELLTSMLPLVQSLGGGGGETSPVTELIRVLGPQAGKMVEDITSTVKDVIAHKTKPVNPQTRPSSVPPVPVPGKEIREIESDDEKEERTKGEGDMMKLLTEVKTAVLNYDTTYFPKLQEVVISNMEDEVYDNLINGLVPVDNIIAQMKPFAGPEIDSPQARNYLEEFISWAKAREVEGVCGNCGEMFTFFNIEELGKDSKCQNCEGEIKPISTNEGQG